MAGAARAAVQGGVMAAGSNTGSDTGSNTEMSVAIRPFEATDQDEVTALFLEENERLMRAFPAFDFRAYGARSLREEFTQIDAYYAAREGGFWVAHIAGAFCGMFGLERRGEDAFELRRMYVSARRRGRGVAKTLLGEAERLTAERRLPWLYLETSELQPRAVAFYKKNGFDVLGAVRPAAQSNKTVGGGVLRYRMRKAVAPFQGDG